jgi:hypothetical protein
MLFDIFKTKYDQKIQNTGRLNEVIFEQSFTNLETIQISIFVGPHYHREFIRQKYVPSRENSNAFEFFSQAN